MEAPVLDMARRALPLLLTCQDFDRSYDKEADVLYITFESAPATDADETDDNIVVRYQGDRIMGLTLLNASARLAALTST